MHKFGIYGWDDHWNGPNNYDAGVFVLDGQTLLSLILLKMCLYLLQNRLGVKPNYPCWILA